MHVPPPKSFLLLLLAAPLAAQQERPTFDWQKRQTALEYGAIPVGARTLEDLKVGSSWHLGADRAASWLLTMPAKIGDTIVAPGEYRLSVNRNGETKCELVVDAIDRAVGAGDSQARIPGEIVKNPKPSKRLQLGWSKAGDPVDGNQPVAISLQFGDVLWNGEAVLLGNKTVSAGPWKLAVFTYTQAQIEAREKVPVAVASLQKGKEPDGWNLVLGKGDAKLVPWMHPPADRHATVAGPDAARGTTGTLAVEPAQVETPVAVLDVREAAMKAGELQVLLAVGKELLRVRVPEPKAKAGK